MIYFSATGFCQIWGDPHYVTFDEKKYNFQGDCDYTLIGDCLNNSEFHLWSDNELRRPSAKVSFLNRVVLTMNKTDYELISGFQVRVKGIDVSENLPYVDRNVKIYRNVKSLVSVGLYRNIVSITL